MQGEVQGGGGGGKGGWRVAIVGATQDVEEVDKGVRASFSHELAVAMPSQDSRKSRG